MYTVDLGVYGLVVNIILYIIPLSVFYILKSSKVIGVFGIIPILMIYEYFINSISFSFPWLTLGNIFSNQHYLIQWYEYTGVLGGSVWILILSYLTYRVINNAKGKYVLSSFLILPILISILLLKKGNPTNFKSTNKKILTYNIEKTNGLQNKEELAYYLKQKIKYYSPINTTLIPEYTFRGIDEANFSKTSIYKHLNDNIKENNISLLFVGGSVIKKKLITNGGLVFSNLDSLPYLKVKNRLVPLTEYLPYFLKGTIKKDTFDPYEFDDCKKITEKLNFLPVICYEIFYSLFVNNNIGDSEIIYLISSEKFFNNSYHGKIQYNNICRLRAIENRIPIIKASNFGNSIHFNHFGNIENKSDKEFNIFNINIPQRNITFYNKYSDILDPIILIVLIICSLKLKK